MRRPEIGQIVKYIQPAGEKPYNGHRDHPAIITAVWSETCVNLKVLFDCGPVEDRTSVCLDTPENPNCYWRWPEPAAKA